MSHRITQISFTDFKGQTRVVPLTGKDIFTGPTGFGKTTVIDAAQIAIMGYHPRQDKKPMAIMKAFASGNPMSVGIECADGLRVTRTFTSKADKFTQDIDIFPAYQERTLTEKTARVAQEFGSFPVMFDINEFLGLSNDKQRDFVFKYLQVIGGWDRKEVINTLSAEMQDFPVDVATKAFACWHSSHDTQTGLANVIAYIKDQVSYLDKKLKDSEAASREITKIKNSEVAMSLSLIEKLKADIETHREELSAAEKALATIQERNRAITAKADAQRKKTARLAELDSIIAAQAISKEPVVEAISEAKSVYAEAVAGSNEGIAKDLRDRISKLQTLKASLESEQKSLRREISGTEEMIKAIGKALCPLIKDSCDRDFTAFRDKKQGEIDTAKQAITKKDEELKEIAVTMGSFQAQLGEAEETQKAITDQAVWITTLETALRTLDEAETLRSDISEIGQVEDTAAAEQAVTTIKAAIKDKEERAKAAEKQKNTLANLEITLSARQATADELKQYKALQTALGPKGIQGRIVKESLTPFLDDINALMAQIDPAKQFFVELTDEKENEVFNLMCMKNGQPVPVTSLSAGESVIGYTSLIASFIKLGTPAGRYLFIDNIEHISNGDPISGEGERYRDHFIAGIGRIAEGFDNIIICGTAGLGQDTTVEGWNVVNYYAEEVAVC